MKAPTQSLAFVTTSLLMDTGRGKSCNEGEIRANHKTNVPILPLEPWSQSLSVGAAQMKIWPPTSGEMELSTL
jgi:hypothetical protein